MYMDIKALNKTSKKIGNVSEFDIHKKQVLVRRIYELMYFEEPL